MLLFQSLMLTYRLSNGQLLYSIARLDSVDIGKYLIDCRYERWRQCYAELSSCTNEIFDTYCPSLGFLGVRGMRCICMQWRLRSITAKRDWPPLPSQELHWIGTGQNFNCGGIFYRASESVYMTAIGYSMTTTQPVPMYKAICRVYCPPRRHQHILPRCLRRPPLNTSAISIVRLMCSSSSSGFPWSMSVYGRAIQDLHSP